MDITFKHQYMATGLDSVTFSPSATPEHIESIAGLPYFNKRAFVVDSITPSNLRNVLDLVIYLEQRYTGTFSIFDISINTSLDKKQFEKKLYAFLDTYLNKHSIMDDARITRPETLYRLKIPARQPKEGTITFTHGPHRSIIFKMILLFGIILENDNKFLKRKNESEFVQYLVNHNLPYLATLFYLRRESNVGSDFKKLARDIHYHLSMDTSKVLEKSIYLPALKLIRDDYGADVTLIRFIPISELARR